MKTIIIFLAKVVLIVLICTNSAWVGEKTNLPNSREAIVVDSESPDGRIMIKATGIHKNMAKSKIDAEKTAIYWLIVERILQTQSEKKRFVSIQENFFEHNKGVLPEYSKFVEYRSAIEKRVKTSDKMYRITMTFKINKKKLENYLIAKKILQSRKTIETKLQKPSFLVLPNVGGEENLEQIVSIINNNSNIRQTASIIKIFLTRREYNVKLPEDMVKRIKINKDLKDIATQKDIDSGRMELTIKRSHTKNLLCLSMGADVYLTYELQFNNDSSVGTKQAIVHFEIYEATTGKLLANEMGVSKPRATLNVALLIAEAVNSGLGDALETMIKYWKTQLIEGVPYLITTHIVSEFEEDDIEDLQDSFANILEGICNFVKEEVVDETQMEYIVYVKLDKFETASKLRRAIRKKFNDEQNNAKLNTFGGRVGKWIQFQIKDASL
jgi:hypothetical protein